MRFKGKTVVITGGANGIGRCIAAAFLREGARVAVIDKDGKGLPCDLFYHGDIAQEDTLLAFVREVTGSFGSVDCLINNACLSKGGILSECGYDDFMYVQRIGVIAPYMLTKLLRPYFNPGASIVNITSTRAGMSEPDTESYTAAKGGISALTHALAVSLAGYVRVNSIAPGWIDTTGGSFSKEDHAQHPVGRVGLPEDIARVVLFLCSEDSGFITGENITVDGGMTKRMVYHNDHGWKFDDVSMREFLPPGSYTPV